MAQEKLTATKTVEMETFCNSLTKVLFGRERDGTVCVSCGSEAVDKSDFVDELSWKEWRISFMCQKCQNEVFGGA